MLRKIANSSVLLALFIQVPIALGMRFVTYNLRYDSKPDNITIQQSNSQLSDPLQAPKYLSVATEASWSTRRLRVAEHLLSENPDVACFQEALNRQVNDLAELLGNDWSWVGVGRDDGVQAGEYSAIFYKNNLKLLSKDYFWLSNTPFEPSKYPGAGSIRICTATHFSTTSSDGSTKNFTLLNTHLDDQSDDQRKLGASMLLARAKYEAVNTESPVFITGDFNSPSSGTDSSAYNIITGASPPVPINATFASKFSVPSSSLPDFKMVDLRGTTPRQSVSTNFATFTGFSKPNDTSSWVRIDFVFGGSNGGWESMKYKVATSLQDDGILASDHRPVFVDLQVN